MNLHAFNIKIFKFLCIHVKLNRLIKNLKQKNQIFEWAHGYSSFNLIRVKQYG